VAGNFYFVHFSLQVASSAVTPVPAKLMGQLESKLDQCERSPLLLSPTSRTIGASDSADAASPPREDMMQPSPQSPPSSPALGRSSLSPGDRTSSPKQSPSRSLLSFWHTSEKRLIEAAKRGDDEEVSDLLTDGTDVNTKTTIKKETPLHKAAQYGNISTALLLLLNGADPLAVGKF
jgi:ankyrin repeat protein